MKDASLFGLRVKVATTVFERCRGLIGRPAPGAGEGLLIPRCNAIHTFGMSYAIDAVFLDAEDRVVRVVRSISPNRAWIFGGWRARKVLELSAGQEKNIRFVI